jgi:hypothetical protein
MIQLSHGIRDSLYHREPQYSRINIGQKLTVIDGFYLQRIYSRIIDEKEMHSTHLHAIFEDDLVCTYDENDGRAHARPIICGSPSIISIAAVFEGPAKPKGYYFKNMLKDLLSMNSKEIEQEYASMYVSYDDPRLVHVLTGYAIQAIFFFLLMVTHFAQIIHVDCTIPIGKKN